MRKTLFLAAMILFAFGALLSGANAQTFDKKSFNYSDWAKGRFSEAVTIVNPGKFIFLAGEGSEDENGKGGDIQYLGDFLGQCRYAYDKIKGILAHNGATFDDVVKIVTYVTDMRFQADVGRCRSEAFGPAPAPVRTLLNITQLAWPGMLVEVDVTAVTAK